MSLGDQKLEAMIAKIRSLPQLAKEAAPEVARALRGDLEEQINKGTDPEGKPWKLTQEGEKPLKNAAKALRVTHLGSRVIFALEGVEARHSLGRVKGGERRQILPETLPASWSETIQEVVSDAFDRHMRGE